MTTLVERYPDILLEPPDAQAQRLVADLDAACAAPAAPAQLRAAIAQALNHRATEPVSRHRSWLAPRRLLAAAATLLAVIGGSAAYDILVHEQGPTPVSAQVILSRAASAGRLAPNQAAHLTYDFVQGVGTGGGVSGPMDVWLQANAAGSTTRYAFTQTIYWSDGTVAAVQRCALPGATGKCYTYDPHANTVSTEPYSAQQLGPDGLNLFDAPSVAAYVARAARGRQGQAHLLPRQTLDGVTVDVVRLDGSAAQDSPPMTFYFDANSYLFRGADLSTPQYSAQLRVTAYTTVAAADLPAHTFDLTVPSAAQVVANVSVPEFTPEGGAPSGSAAPNLHLLEPMKVLPAICHTTAAALRATLHSGGKSPLTACQVTDTGVTQAGLVAALSATLKSNFDAAVAAGTMTAADEAQRLDGMQTRLTTWVVTLIS